MRNAIFLTGGTGYLGGLIAAVLLSSDDCRLVLPIRPHHTRQSALAPIRAELAASGIEPDTVDFNRVLTPVAWTIDDLSAWGVSEIIHCAGCLDYFDREALEEVNVQYTRNLLEIGMRLGLRRFVYVSTAFSSGFRDDLIREGAHPEPREAPTAYISSKWRAEQCVADCPLPFLIVRPSIVIGHSQDGRYAGRNYGLYQLWSAIERFMLRDDLREVHVVARDVPLPLLHQDAFQVGILAALCQPPGRSYLNLVSADDGRLPTVRRLYELWFGEVLQSAVIHYHGRLSEVPMHRIDRAQRTFLKFSDVNSEIASRRWTFETGCLDALRAKGLQLHDVTEKSALTCQEAFMRASARVRKFRLETA